jgi:hypothetical protein
VTVATRLVHRLHVMRTARGRCRVVHGAAGRGHVAHTQRRTVVARWDHRAAGTLRIGAWRGHVKAWPAPVTRLHGSNSRATVTATVEVSVAGGTVRLSWFGCAHSEVTIFYDELKTLGSVKTARRATPRRDSPRPTHRRRPLQPGARPPSPRGTRSAAWRHTEA